MKSLLLLMHVLTNLTKHVIKLICRIHKVDTKLTDSENLILNFSKW